MVVSCRESHRPQNLTAAFELQQYGTCYYRGAGEQCVLRTARPDIGIATEVIERAGSKRFNLDCGLIATNPGKTIDKSISDSRAVASRGKLTKALGGGASHR